MSKQNVQRASLHLAPEHFRHTVLLESIAEGPPIIRFFRLAVQFGGIFLAMRARGSMGSGANASPRTDSDGDGNHPSKMDGGTSGDTCFRFHSGGRDEGAANPFESIFRAKGT